MVKRFVIALVLVVLICGGLVGFNLFRTKMINNFFAHMPQQAVAVSTAKVEPTNWQPQIDAIGTLWAFQGVDVASQVAGVVQTIAVKANQHVEKDQLLVQIEDSVERADLQSAEAAVSRDQAQLARVQTLRKTGVNSQATLQDAESALAASQSSLAKIKATLDLKAIEAPFAGVAGIVRVDVGQYVQAGTVIVTLQQLDKMKVDFTVPEQAIDQIKLGQPAKFGLTGEEFPYQGKIIGIDPKVDPQTRLVSVQAEVDNPNGELRPGQFVRVRVVLPAVANVIALPQTAVVTSLYGDYVYVVEAEDANAKAGTDANAPLRTTIPPDAGADANANAKLVAKQTFVKVGHRQGDLIEINSGLQPGQTIVTSGQNKLSNNAPVTVANDTNVAEDGGGSGS
jgi:membrane fusion protein (multidrug efflux system)